VTMSTFSGTAYHLCNNNNNKKNTKMEGRKFYKPVLQIRALDIKLISNRGMKLITFQPNIEFDSIQQPVHLHK
jgi:hypothetical protein